MSECVVRIEMPLNCFECPMYDWNRQKLCCNAHLDLRPIPNGGVPKPDWCPIICSLPEGHGPLVDFNDVSKELRKYGYIVKDETTGIQYTEYPIVLEQNPIRISTIVPAERSET